jgi:hypothetical protein
MSDINFNTAIDDLLDLTKRASEIEKEIKALSAKSKYVAEFLCSITGRKLDNVQHKQDIVVESNTELNKPWKELLVGDLTKHGASKTSDIIDRFSSDKKLSEEEYKRMCGTIRVTLARLVEDEKVKGVRVGKESTWEILNT